VSNSQQLSRMRGALDVAARVTSFVLGWGMIWWQMLFVDPSQVNETFLWIAAALVGVPGAAEALSRITNAGSSGGSASTPPSSPSPSSSPTSSEGEGE
jgi:hypothetical protein